jgi:hypothetical protein
MAAALTQAELALRFRERQNMLPHCAACGVRIRRGDGVCTTCGETRTPRTVAPLRRSTTPLTVEPGVHIHRAKLTFKPKPCKEPSCRKLFTPTGGRSEYCEDCR